MKTDIPLKRLTHLCPADLLALVGTADAEVLGVETLQLPTSQTSLDTVLRLRGPDQQDYLHLLEWQGYLDTTLLWRTLGYLAWMGQNRDERPLLATIIYLTPEADVGDTITQLSQMAGGWAVTFSVIRLWEQDATAALASGMPGLMVLAPLMAGATPDLVEQVAQTLIDEVEPPIQGELLATLAVFAEPLLDVPRFIQLVTKERLMNTDLISYLFAEQMQEFEREKAMLVEQKETLAEEKETLVEQKAQLELQHVLQQTVADTIATRFPGAPFALFRDIQHIRDSTRLQQVIQAVVTAPDLSAVEQALAAARTDA